MSPVFLRNEKPEDSPNFYPLKFGFIEIKNRVFVFYFNLDDLQPSNAYPTFFMALGLFLSSCYVSVSIKKLSLSSVGEIGNLRKSRTHIWCQPR